MADYNEQVINDFRANKGKLSGAFGGMELLLLHSTGAKSGKTYVRPVAYTMDGNNFVVVASKGGAPTNPDWYYNLLAHPDTTIEVGSETLSVRAKPAEGAERQRLFDQHAGKYPGFAGYQAKTNRVIPVFVLEKM